MVHSYGAGAVDTSVNYSIEELSEENISRVLEIENASFRSPWHRALFEVELKNRRSYNIACIDESDENRDLIGYCLSWLIYDEIHILKVAVDEKFRNQGIGSEMIVKTLEHFIPKGATHAVLEVRLDNYGARSLYEKLGFEDLRIRRNYYSETGEDALVMGLDLNGYRGDP